MQKTQVQKQIINTELDKQWYLHSACSENGKHAGTEAMPYLLGHGGYIQAALRHRKLYVTDRKRINL